MLVFDRSRASLVPLIVPVPYDRGKTTKTSGEKNLACVIVDSAALREEAEELGFFAKKFEEQMADFKR